jgi:hypothetical protein
MTLTLTQELLQLLNEAINYAPLKGSEEFKRIAQKDKTLSQGLELAWGYPEFYVYIKKVMDSGRVGKDSFNLDNQTKTDLGVLTALHQKTFPNTKNELKKDIRPDVWGPQYERGFFREMTEAEVEEMKAFLAE